MTVLFYISIALFLGLCGLLCLMILVQESKSMGLGASFGGDSGDSLFGTSTADVLKKITAYLAAIFMIAAVALSMWTSKIGRTKVTAPPLAIEETTR